MSGHSKWANIKRKKEANDKVKGNLFGKLSKAITLSVLEGGGITDPNGNIRLRLAIEKARAMNMPKDNIQRAIEKGSGPGKQDLKHVLYEGFFHGGAAALISCTTDNANKTHAEVRNVLEKYGGKMASQGAVSYMFQHTGVITFERSKNDESVVMQFAERIDASDFEEDDEYLTIYFPFEQIGKIKEQLGDLTGSAPEVIYRPTTTVELDKESGEKVTSLIEKIEELDDVQAVFTNAAIISS